MQKGSTEGPGNRLVTETAPSIRKNKPILFPKPNSADKSQETPSSPKAGPAPQPTKSVFSTVPAEKIPNTGSQSRAPWRPTEWWKVLASLSRVQPSTARHTYLAENCPRRLLTSSYITTSAEGTKALSGNWMCEHLSMPVSSVWESSQIFFQKNICDLEIYA